MKIMTFRKRASAHLPPLIKQPKIYTIRKNNRCHYSSEISYNPDTQTKPFNSERNLLELKQDTPLAYSLNEFEISKCVSKGKGGCVLMATLNYRNYALKVIHKKLSKYALAEAKILDKLSSQLIVKYFGRFEDEENIYLVLEFINGCDFFHYMSRKRLKLPEIVNLASQVLSAIELIHSKGIVYRDLKPENIMLPESGCIKLIDFGLSKEIGNERTSTVCGSPEYMAPEVIRKNSYSYAVDFWSFGILLYEMLCGHPPFQGESYQEICQNILMGSFEFTRSIDPVSKDLVRRLLDNEPAYRLGNLQGKAIDVKKHKFFRDIIWDFS